jgi:hypothetical protein
VTVYDVGEVCSISPSKRGLLSMWLTTDGGMPPPLLPPQPARDSSAQTTPITADLHVIGQHDGALPAGGLGELREISKAFGLSIVHLPMADQRHWRQRVSPPLPGGLP